MFPGESFNHTADMVGKDEIRKKGDNIISAGGTIHTFAC